MINVKFVAAMRGVFFLFLPVAIGMIGCGGSSAKSTYTVGGRVIGLSGTLTLQNNGNEKLNISADGEFTFITPVVDGGSYSVTVVVTPFSQWCSVANGFGIISGEKFTGIMVPCLNLTCTDGLKNNNETDVDCGGGPPCPACDMGKECVQSSDCLTVNCFENRCSYPFHNCKEILDQTTLRENGIYQIDPSYSGPRRSFYVYCDLTTDGGGWTLTLKADGSKNTFKYDSDLWTTDKLLNWSNPAFDHTEAKLESFNSVPFTEVRLGLELITSSLPTPPNPNYIKISKSAPSLLDVFKTNTLTQTYNGRAAWMGLITGSVLQPNCNQEGFNNTATDPSYWKVRLGLLANNEPNDCASTDSFIGIGASDTPISTPAPFVGDHAYCPVPTNFLCETTTNLPAFGYLFVR